jgi:hypothetical protein
LHSRPGLENERVIAAANRLASIELSAFLPPRSQGLTFVICPVTSA